MDHSEPVLDQPLWLRGFFTGRRHAVVNLADRVEFHGMLLGWSVCNRLVVLDEPASGPAGDATCFRCAFSTSGRRTPGAMR